MDVEASSPVRIKEWLQSWIAQGASIPLPNWVYSSMVTRDPRVFEPLRAAGILTVSPVAKNRDVGPLRRTPLGVLPLSLVEFLGVAEELSDYVFAQLVPRCPRCDCAATSPVALDTLTIPRDGVIAVSVVEEEAAESLRERCEWLGSERAIVGERLIRVEEISADVGEPVVAVVPGAEYGQLQHEVSRWFARGGGTVRLVHFTSREALGRELGQMTGRWFCGRCSLSVAQPTRAAFDAAPQCPTCKGSGWLHEGSTRRIACRDCDGFGASLEVAHGEFHGVPLRHVAVLSFEEFAHRAADLPDAVRQQLDVIVACGFGEYPLGTPMGLLSQGERALLAVLSGELSRFTDICYLIDGALGDFGPTRALPQPSSSRLVIARPEVDGRTAIRWRPQREGGEPDVVLRDVRQGCLQIPEVRFPIGGLTALAGPVGSGKSLLLSIVHERFSKRRKLAHQSSFGALKRCSVVRAEVSSEVTVVEALGLADELAFEIARTRKAQELGVLREDLVLPHSRYRCPTCLGSAGVDERCEECMGALYDWRIAELPVAGRTVAELLTTPLGELVELPWTSEAIAHVARTYPMQILAPIALGTPLLDLPRPEQRFLAVWGGLSRVGGGAQRRGKSTPLANDLVLVDGPRMMPVIHRHAIEKLLFDINGMGATVVYADIPEGLEFACSCVIQLGVRARSSDQRVQEPYLDARYARVCGERDKSL